MSPSSGGVGCGACSGWGTWLAPGCASVGATVSPGSLRVAWGAAAWCTGVPAQRLLMFDMCTGSEPVPNHGNSPLLSLF
jgi:hypothetical protein